MPKYTGKVINEWASILKDGVMITTDEVLKTLNKADKGQAVLSNSTDGLLRSAMRAAYAELQNNRPGTAKQLLITGLLGGSVNNCLDIERCNKEWARKYQAQ